MTSSGAGVSVVIPTYNHAKFLAEAIRSVERQTHRPLEIVVVDNNSTDDTSAVVAESVELPTRYIRFANGGVIAASRNVGIKASAGDIVAFLDADDQWEPDKLARQLPHLADLSVSAVASDLRYNGPLKYSRSRLAGRAPYRDYDYSQIVRNNPIATSTTIVRRADLETVGGFDESPEFRVIEDWDLWLRLARHGRIRVLAEPLVTYRTTAAERPRMPILTNKLTLIDKHVRLGYLTPADASAAEASVRFAMGVASFADNAEAARANFVAARRLSDNSRARRIAALGLALTSLPAPVRRAGLALSRLANRWARFA